MKIENNINLSKKTTFHIGGRAKKFIVFESEKELLQYIKEANEKKYYVISGGSNLLINDNLVIDTVISMEQVDNEISQIENGKFYIGCSNKIQNVIHKINEYGYGGIEELYSLPALFGGIIYMNAGIGGKNNVLFTISDFIESVKVINIKNKKIEWVNKNDCNFSHRSSLFHNNQYIILGAKCNFYKQDLTQSKKRISDRIKYAKDHQEWGKGCFGTCFSEADRKLLKVISLLSFNKKGIYQSNINSNWLVNDGTGTFKKAMKIINRCKSIHKLFHKNIKCEVQIWE